MWLLPVLQRSMYHGEHPITLEYMTFFLYARIIPYVKVFWQDSFVILYFYGIKINTIISYCYATHLTCAGEEKKDEERVLLETESFFVWDAWDGGCTSECEWTHGIFTLEWVIFITYFTECLLESFKKKKVFFSVWVKNI